MYVCMYNIHRVVHRPRVGHHTILLRLSDVIEAIQSILKVLLRTSSQNWLEQNAKIPLRSFFRPKKVIILWGGDPLVDLSEHACRSLVCRRVYLVVS